MNRNIKYKQVSRIMLFGDDDVNTSTNSQYIVYPSTINGITVNNGGTNYNASYTQIKILVVVILVLLQRLLYLVVLLLLLMSRF